jgi:3-isopropylmalate/(R)-2-methylmalate dehydratase small subunit
VVFDGLGPHSFEDDRAQLKAKGSVHPFDDARFQGASILLVNKNFGCGSSREHAPQALMRWGIRAVVGESFAEIFFGNCVSLGIPCATVSEAAAARLQAAAEANPQAAWSLDVAAGTVSGAGVTETAGIPDGPRSQFLTGRWNSLNELLERSQEVEKVAAALPYVHGW